jgi:hypothetical protein
LKTHTAWTYAVLERGSYLWTSPHGVQLLRDRDGTTDVTRPDAPARPDASRTAGRHLLLVPDP